MAPLIPYRFGRALPELPRCAHTLPSRGHDCLADRSGSGWFRRWRVFWIPDVTEIDPRRGFVEIFAELAVELHDAPSVADTAETVVEFALQALSCQHAGLALAVHGGRLEIGAVTSPVVEALYQLQIDTGKGPALAALDGGSHNISVPDITVEDRWPAWAEHARAAGICSVLHAPMTATANTIGVLPLFSNDPHAFDNDDEAIAHLLAQHATVAIANARQDETMRQAVDARRLVGQAVGILMERFAVDEDRAFAILRRYSHTPIPSSATSHGN